MVEQENPALEHIRRLLKDDGIPQLPEDMAGNPVVVEIHGEIKALREVLRGFSQGDLSREIETQGVISEYVKTLQAHLRKMIWQVQVVEQGDFAPQVQFMGEFFTAFNDVVTHLDLTLQDLRRKEKALTAMTENLQQEVSLRNSVVETLQESESRFKYLASHDALTGALNRRSFIERSAAELQMAMVRKIPCCMVMMDIDHFKIFNDTYGHLAGDDALRHTVRLISSTLRRNDFMGRYGGEEFVLLLNGADLDTGIAVAERVRESLASAPVMLDLGPVPISASFGVSLAADPDDPEDKNYVQTLINNADIAMYQAKKTGRNRVVYFGQYPEEISRAVETR
jgi:diguanylate cyclase (GGDEF)-like protein